MVAAHPPIRKLQKRFTASFGAYLQASKTRKYGLVLFWFVIPGICNGVNTALLCRRCLVDFSVVLVTQREHV